MSSYWRRDLFKSHPQFTQQIHNAIEQSPGLFVRLSDGRVDHRTDQQNINSPWLFTGVSPVRHCELWNAVYWGCFRVIPSFCRFCCWKVVIKPKSVKDLLQLYRMFKDYDINGKCGLDVREYTEGPYAGFIYNDSLKEGREMLRFIQGILPDYFTYVPSSILKRGCTEMELGIPSDQWDDISEEDMIKEKMLDEIFVKHESVGQHSNWLIQDRINRWIRHAIQIGDPTWRYIVEDPSLYLPHTVRYDNNDLFYETMSDKGSEKALSNM